MTFSIVPRIPCEKLIEQVTTVLGLLLPVVVSRSRSWQPHNQTSQRYSQHWSSSMEANWCLFL